MARRKIYDVRPPEKSGVSLGQKKKKVFSGVFSEGPSQKRKKEAKRIFSLRNLAGVLVVALLGTFLFFHFSARAKIEVYPSKRNVSAEGTVLSKTSVLSPSFTEGEIRGKFFKREKDIKGTFEATGVSDTGTYAAGTIRVVNNYHLPQTLVSYPGRRTRFLSASGKLFYLQETVEIPSGDSVEAEVEAAEPGPDYNIAPTKFSIPGLLGSDRYTAIYAESTGRMTGGSVGEVAKVREEDLTRAEEELEARAKTVLKEVLEKEWENFFVPEDALKVTVAKTEASAEVDEEASEFEFKITVKGEGLGWHREDLASFAEYKLEEGMGEDERVERPSIATEVDVRRANLEKGELELFVETSGVGVKRIDEAELRKALMGSTMNESTTYFSNYPAVEKAKVEISPFWVQRIPADMDRVEVTIAAE